MDIRNRVKAEHYDHNGKRYLRYKTDNLQHRTREKICLWSPHRQSVYLQLQSNNIYRQFRGKTSIRAALTKYW